jgi:hypothetical protein
MSDALPVVQHTDQSHPVSTPDADIALEDDFNQINLGAPSPLSSAPGEEQSNDIAESSHSVHLMTDLELAKELDAEEEGQRKSGTFLSNHLRENREPNPSSILISTREATVGSSCSSHVFCEAQVWSWSWSWARSWSGCYSI